FGSVLSFADPNLALKFSPTLKGSTISKVEAINAVANYWKHAEEWLTREEKVGNRLREVWDLPNLHGKQRSTAEIVVALGLVPNSDGNLRRSVKALGARRFDDLSPIRQILRNWATELLKKTRIEFGVKP